jgi:VIT1/CCC1 family predicted Fe2+/Mn2+ transporter
MHHEEKESILHGTNKGLIGKCQDYLSEFVYGGIDGSVTTFAVVAGSAGANLDSSIVIILGFANLIADGFSMSVGSYLSTKSSKEAYQKHKKIEYWEVENIPEKEREEVREIYRQKGFEGELLDKVVDKITEDKDRWVDLMMKEELEMTPDSKSPFGMGLVTFISFFIMGLIPLSIYVVDYISPADFRLFLISSMMTGLCFLGIGYLKSIVNHTSKLRSMAETLLLGGAAAVLSYVVGNYLEKLLS